MTQRQLIKAFFDRKVTNAKASSLYVTGNRLVYYQTTLAEYNDGAWIINTTKYSPMTSKLQTYIRTDAHYCNEPKQYVDGLPRGTSYLSFHCKAI